MRTSFIIATFNDGELLAKTVASVFDTYGDAQPEIIVSDDGSVDDGVHDCVTQFPSVQVTRHPERLGPSPTKDHAARQASGDVLVFLDAHCKSEAGAFTRLVANVLECATAVFVPQVAALDARKWTNKLHQCGCGAKLDLLSLRTPWALPGELPTKGKHVLSPGLVGCCAAMTRALYVGLHGFDADMQFWGAEDADFGLKVWLSGAEVLCDPEAIVGHRFQTRFDHYEVPDEHVLANQMRMAYKNFSFTQWQKWLERRRPETSTEIWHAAWNIFCERRYSAEEERLMLRRKRLHDERWFARRFGLAWPPIE